MHVNAMTTLARKALLFVGAFGSLSAIVGGIGILGTNGLGMPLSLLRGSPFTSFIVPGIILLVVVGGTQASATIALALRQRAAYLWMSIAGFGMVIWILVEVAILPGFSPIQALYFGVGIIELMLVLAVIGVLPQPSRVPVTGPSGRAVVIP